VAAARSSRGCVADPDVDGPVVESQRQAAGESSSRARARSSRRVYPNGRKPPAILGEDRPSIGPRGSALPSAPWPTLRSTGVAGDARHAAILEAKRQYRDAIVFFRMGDFYEMFYEDALVAARALELALTSRSKDVSGAAIPMCGVPHHAADGYIARLVKKGFRVAICEQIEDPARPRASSSGPSCASSRPARSPTRAIWKPGAGVPALPRAGRAGQWPDGRTAPHHRRRPHRRVDRRILRGGVCRRECDPGPGRRVGGPSPPRGDHAVHRGARRTASGSGDGRDPRDEAGPWLRVRRGTSCALRAVCRRSGLEGFGLANRPLAIAAAGALVHYLRRHAEGGSRPRAGDPVSRTE